MADMRMLECRGLRRSFGDLVAVDGAGKTTTISMIPGPLERDGGEVMVAGEPMTTHAMPRR